MAIIWLDLRVNDLPRAQEFYRCLLDWRYESFEDEAAVIVKEGDEILGMLSVANGEVAGPANAGAVPYFEVRDLRAALQVATSMGATVEFGPEEDAGGSSFADILDPVGLRVGLLQEAPLPTAESGD